MNDDELRERLHAMPEPSTPIDADAVVVVDTRRRRRPKVVAVAVASVVGCLAFLAPVVVPGLLGPDPVTAALQEAGDAEQSEQSAAPAAPTPPPAASGGDEPDATTLQTEESSGVDVARERPSGCSATPVGDAAPGLAITFESAPADGTATLLLSNGGVTNLTVRLGDVGEGVVADDSIVAAAQIGVVSVFDGPLLRLEPGEPERVEVDVAPADACDGGTGDAGDVVPVVAVAIGPGAEVREVVLGDPLAP